MIGNELEQEILALFDNDLFSAFSINQIAARLNKAYPYINKKAAEFIESGIFNRMVAGRSYLCSLNLASEHTRILLSMSELRKKQKEGEKNPLIYQVEAALLNYATSNSLLCSFIDSEILYNVVLPSTKIPPIAGIESHQISIVDFQKKFQGGEYHPRKHIIVFGASRYFELLAPLQNTRTFHVAEDSK